MPAEPRWFVEIVLPAANGEPDAATHFQLEIYSEEWGYRFSHAGRMSWIRVTDIPFVHGRDDHSLLRETPPLRDISRLVRALEQRHRIELARDRVSVRTNVTGAESYIRDWAASL